jgi:hypothetical protein
MRPPSRDPIQLEMDAGGDQVIGDRVASKRFPDLVLVLF